MEQVILDHFFIESIDHSYSEFPLMEIQNTTKSISHSNHLSSLFGSFANFIFVNQNLVSGFSEYTAKSRSGVYQTVINQKLEGISITFFDNGIVETLGRYENGKVEGTWRLWDRNGEMREKCNYKNGKEEGLRDLWDENGSKILTSQYFTDSSGYLVAFSETWWKNGKRKFKSFHNITRNKKFQEHYDFYGEKEWICWNDVKLGFWRELFFRIFVKNSINREIGFKFFD